MAKRADGRRTQLPLEEASKVVSRFDCIRAILRVRPNQTIRNIFTSNWKGKDLIDFIHRNQVLNVRKLPALMLPINYIRNHHGPNGGDVQLGGGTHGQIGGAMSLPTALQNCLPEFAI
ncbi:hypothetical protein L3X38_017096 [Prunus dulcis]|uniref:Uncharacterized protein n=1 Tax=Prunus dulcis TaxID=3755 RepID=A0AAD4Z9G4_PRUDU|nr:hypothetical protein L3X38_017096 [Prunus dulcis]